MRRRVRGPRRWSDRGGTLAKDDRRAARACRSVPLVAGDDRRLHRQHHPGAARGRSTCRSASARSPAATTTPAGTPANQRHRQPRLGDGASRPGRQRHGPGDDDQQHGLGEPARQLRVLQPARAALHRRFLPQHQCNAGSATATLTADVAREPRQRRGPDHPVHADQLDEQRQRRHRRAALSSRDASSVAADDRHDQPQPVGRELPHVSPTAISAVVRGRHLHRSCHLHAECAVTAAAQRVARGGAGSWLLRHRSRTALPPATYPRRRQRLAAAGVDRAAALARLRADAQRRRHARGCDRRRAAAQRRRRGSAAGGRLYLVLPEQGTTARAGELASRRAGCCPGRSCPASVCWSTRARHEPLPRGDARAPRSRPTAITCRECSASISISKSTWTEHMPPPDLYHCRACLAQQSDWPSPGAAAQEFCRGRLAAALRDRHQTRRAHAPGRSRSRTPRRRRRPTTSARPTGSSRRTRASRSRRASTSDSCRPWVAIERREITVPGGGRYRFRFEVEPPADAPPRECRFALMIEGDEQTAQTADGMSSRSAAASPSSSTSSIGDGGPELQVVDSEVSRTSTGARCRYSRSTTRQRARAARRTSSRGTDALGRGSSSRRRRCRSCRARLAHRADGLRRAGRGRRSRLPGHDHGRARVGRETNAPKSAHMFGQ